MIRVPGNFLYVLPVGAVQINCAVGQLTVRPAFDIVQKVLSKWWYRLA